MKTYQFEWDDEKDAVNQDKHHVSFEEAAEAFYDPRRLIVRDKRHRSRREERYFCIGRINRGIVMVRFTYRNEKIRIYGAGFWREGRERYEARK